MRIAYLLFTCCMLLIFWGFPRLKFLKSTALTTGEIRWLLALKIISGICLAWYFKEFSTNRDYFIINEEGYLQYQLLTNQPGQFFSDFSGDIQRYGFTGLFETHDSFWAYLRFTLLYKGIAILNVITKGNFYFNTALFCSLVFFGHIAFFRIYHSIYQAHKWKILVACFCLPSLLIYTACIHKDGITFLCLGVIGYIFYRFLSGRGSLKWVHIFAGALSLLLIFLFRNYVLVAVIPAMVIGIISRSSRWKKASIVVGCYLLFITVFFLTSFSDSINLPGAVVQRKADFAALEGGTTNIRMNELQPTLLSFAKNFPLAMNHSLMRPYIWEFNRLEVVFTALELLFYQLLILLFLLYRNKGAGIHPFNLFGLALFINMILIIGYTIPNIGAIVRYRSIFWLLLICPLLANIDWKKLPVPFAPAPKSI